MIFLVQGLWQWTTCRIEAAKGIISMKIVFSRKGFDSAAGGAPSPIIDGRPISLPIPTQRRSLTTYGTLGLGEYVEQVTKGRLTRASLCHCDPMFERGRCAFGQTGAAQTHLANHGVGVGDAFLFFGLFAGENGKDRHHRIFGYLEVESVEHVGQSPGTGSQPVQFSQRHPHTIGEWNPNNTIYLGPGDVATTASQPLRLSRQGEQVTQWRVPSWLCKAGLTYHSNPDRWKGTDSLTVVGRGQEFVADITTIPEAVIWLAHVKAAIAGRSE
jgi:Nucleotide modification associated domain 3